MAQPYSDRIKLYCEQHGIEVPPGFHRRAASRYVAIDLDRDPPRLVAATWFKQEDLHYYITRLASGKALRLLDFHERTELCMGGDGKLERGPAF